MTLHDEAGAEYPALEAFCLGYLHEDFTIVHGDALAAMDAFIAEADPQDLVLLARDWYAVREATAALDDPDRVDVLARLGAAWAPASWGDVETVFSRLDAALAAGESL